MKSAINYKCRFEPSTATLCARFVPRFLHKPKIVLEAVEIGVRMTVANNNNIFCAVALKMSAIR